ncbi:hypothetical protein MIMGU_mgv1a015633mg [Erythranthe guttata]|uniref:Plant bHLH transcription factor ACT-like domain-containing protein n=1 Tax=Erythranthe guttata TaxID=4155 RepID=A0A022RTC8_ERYGU|nr:PREDICTED: uncharacterized protein LOC105951601 [Erythranthe guttata]EYU43319.1 hypothetical protein MIMGU_mgv1a015633mg [Erythranthe guttata]|eukprot:XP_012830509.1 PREDICTED: uncharacterized protein LOC105951601 [Erythranthe guttata]
MHAYSFLFVLSLDYYIEKLSNYTCICFVKVTRSSIIMDAFLYIYRLKLQVEAIKREYQSLINHIQEVKVEKIGTTGYLAVTVTCKKLGDEEMVGPIMEVFEKMNVNVVQVRVSSQHFFGMEAIVEDNIDAAILNQAILRVVQTQTQKIGLD